MNRPTLKTIGRYTALSAFVLSIAGVAAAAAGVRVNVTRSVPLGFYRTTDEPIHKGAYVIFCPPQRELFALALKRRYIEPGDCPGGSYPMMKRILAAKNDRVQIGPNGIVINGVAVPNSKPRPYDGAKRELPHFVGSGKIAAGDVIVVGESKVSFDSRYFGPIPRQQISTVVRPIVTW
ncbi:conjugative transfer signal peptidase TraF [Sphingomonas oryzagri]